MRVTLLGRTYGIFMCCNAFGFFTWLTYRQWLMNDLERCQCSIGNNPLCPCFHELDESVLHTLRDCRNYDLVDYILRHSFLWARYYADASMLPPTSTSSNNNDIQWPIIALDGPCLNVDGRVSPSTGVGYY
ncbi:hypothetical protein V6N12_032831 [Hibiscus sabdariffa]|uniref:Uncharacterized protein n=1 Tax=Hibiscus sabdariffa TaxID=183260 RepID=A0ABR2AHP5_9ROSI